MREEFAAAGKATWGGGGVPQHGDGKVGVIARVDGEVDGRGMAESGGVAEEEDVEKGDAGGVGCRVCDVDDGREGEGVFGCFEDLEGADLGGELGQVVPARGC